MKSISPALSNHLDKEVTTLATCWKVVRRDGKEFYFTDHDQDIVFDGDTYEAEASYNRTAVANGTDFSVDNLDVDGVLDSERITDHEMRAGLFNRADVYIFIVNWQSPDDGPLKVRRGWFGEVVLDSNGVFRTEIRGLAQALSHNFIEVYAPECRADFCDTRCKLNITDFIRLGTVTEAENSRDTFKASELPDAPSTGTSAGAHKTWAIRPTAVINPDYFAIAEVRFWDQDNNLITGGKATDSVRVNNKPAPLDGHKPKNARDFNMKTSWAVKYKEKDGSPIIQPLGHRLMITFDSPVDVKSFEIIATDNLSEVPTAFVLEYTDESNLDLPGLMWSVAKDASVTWEAPGQSAVWGLGSADDQPINIATSPTDIPPPYNTVSSYDGGTITWLTGRNAGRSVEITGYTDATNEVELFEAMGYPIQIGDTFEIAQGCDKSLARCKLYDNVINRRAEDFVPGNDEMMSYPNAPNT